MHKRDGPYGPSLLLTGKISRDIGKSGISVFLLAPQHQAGAQSAHQHTAHPQHQLTLIAGGGGIGCGGLLRLLGLAGLHGSGRLLSAAAAALAILVVVAQSGNHLALLHRDAADLADLVAGVAVLGAGGILGTHQLRVVAGGGDDLRLGIGVVLTLEGVST